MVEITVPDTDAPLKQIMTTIQRQANVTHVGRQLWSVELVVAGVPGSCLVGRRASSAGASW